MFSYGAVLPNEATNMGLMDISSVAPTWLDEDCSRESERNGGQVFFALFFFFMIFFFSPLPFELLLFYLSSVLGVLGGFNRGFTRLEGEGGKKPRCSI